MNTVNFFLMLVQTGLLAAGVQPAVAVAAMAKLGAPTLGLYIKAFGQPNIPLLQQYATEYVLFVAGMGPEPAWFKTYWAAIPVTE